MTIPEIEIFVEIVPFKRPPVWHNGGDPATVRLSCLDEEVVAQATAKSHHKAKIIARAMIEAALEQFGHKNFQTCTLVELQKPKE